jgi:hypothetical protein
MKAGLLSSAFLLLLAVAALPAQDGRKLSEDPNTRSLQGAVSDSSGKPVQGAVVQLKDTKSLQIRSFYTEADGGYHFAGLSSNTDYEVKADHNGSSSGSKTLSNFDGRKTAVINLKLK